MSLIVRLREYREEVLKISQTDLAKRIGEDVSQISRWEKSGKPPIEAILKIVSEFEIGTVDELVRYKQSGPKPIVISGNWEKTKFTKENIMIVLEEALKNMNLSKEKIALYLEEMQIIVSNIKKPMLAFIGRSDAGKTSLINVLLETVVLLAKPTPMTAIAVYIKHISDKPSHIKDTVCIFQDPYNKELWNESKLHDAEYCRRWKEAEGSLDVLELYGTREGAKFDAKIIRAAVVFLNAPILEVCDIMDLPGYGTDEKNDDVIAYRAAAKADIAVYLAAANAFMRPEDFPFIKSQMKDLPTWERKGRNNLPPLGNLFIIASYADVFNDKKNLENVLKSGCERLWKSLPDSPWSFRAEVSGYEYKERGKNELLDRFFTFSIKNPKHCEQFFKELKKTLEVLPTIFNTIIEERIKAYAEEKQLKLDTDIKNLENADEEHEQNIQILKSIDEGNPFRLQENDNKKNEIREIISLMKEENISEFDDIYQQLTNADAIAKRMDEEKVANRNYAIEGFASRLQSLIQEKTETIASTKLVNVIGKIEEYVTFYGESALAPFNKSRININFDAQEIYTKHMMSKGLFAGLGVLGLGAAGLGVLTLASVGAKVAIAAVVGKVVLSAVFPPILIVGGVLALAGALFGILSGYTWQQKVAKKIAKSFEDSRFGEVSREGIKNFWASIADSFEQAANGLEQAYEIEVEELRRRTTIVDPEQIQQEICVNKKLVELFEKIKIMIGGN